MFKVTNQQGKDFTLLCLTDPQLNNGNFGEKSKFSVLEYTVKELVRRVKPDLIAVLGDLSHANHLFAYDKTGDLFDSLGIPWTFCFGNHDMQKGEEPAREVVKRYEKYENLLFEEGDSSLGVGNFVIKVDTDGMPAEALILMDTHSLEKYKNPDGSERDVCARLTARQIEWYKETVEALKKEGYLDSTMMLHIPISAFRDATKVAFKEGIDKKTMTLEGSKNREVWNEGYKDSFGVQHEALAIHPDDDGVFQAIKEVGTTKNVIAGHDHTNCSSIKYEGVRLTYCLKTGPGYTWESELNGGTVLKIDKKGVCSVSHEVVKAEHLLLGVDF